MKDVGDGYVFKSGKTFYANCSIVGIDPSGEVSEGYDGSIDLETFTQEERIELAEYMIDLWTKFKEDKFPKDK